MGGVLAPAVEKKPANQPLNTLDKLEDKISK